MNLMNGTGLDGRSVLVGAGLVLAGMVAAHSGAVIPLLVMGGIAYFIGSKKGWWGDKTGPKRGPAAGPPVRFDDWRRQAEAYGQQGPWNQQWNAAPPPPPAQPARPAQPTPPSDREIHIPVTNAQGYRRTVGEAGEQIV
jgi:hypothetical protein